LACILPRAFYERDTEIVAKEILGRTLIRKMNDTFLEGVIVETEAYYGLTDPASRAYHGLKQYNKPMWKNSGITFIYNVHKYWMLNIVAHLPQEIGAVLLRAIEPIKGIELMKRNRSVENIVELTNGPGKLTIALQIDKRMNGLNIFSEKSRLAVINSTPLEFEIASSHRIGVRKDLERKLRFYIKGNKFVSKI